MKEEATRKTLKATVVFQAPDVCLTPAGPSMVPVPYPIIGKFSDSIVTTPTVKMTSEEAFNTDSKVATVIGDEAGVGGGVKSGVFKNVCEFMTYSPTVFAAGKNIVRHDDMMWMNNKNTIGKVVYPIGLAANVAASSPEAMNPPTELTPPEQSWWEKAKLLERGVGALQIVGGVQEVAVGEAMVLGSGVVEFFSGGTGTPVAVPTALVGGVAMYHGADSFVAGVGTMVTGQVQTTTTQKMGAAAAKKLGASDQDSQAIGAGVDLAVGLLGPVSQLAKYAAAKLAANQAKKMALRAALKETAELAAEKGAGSGGAAVTKTIQAGITHPFGFKNPAQFEQAMQELKAALAKNGIDDAKVGVRGSAVTGQSTKGGPFRFEPVGDLPASDVDTFIQSAKLSKQIPPNSRKVPGMTKPETLMDSMPELQAWSDKWSKELGREVTPAAFSETPTGSPIIWGAQ